MEGLLSKKIHKQKYQCILKQAHILQIFLVVNSNDVSSTHYYANVKEDQRGLCLRGVLKFGLCLTQNFHLKLYPVCKTNPLQNHAHVIQIISN